MKPFLYTIAGEEGEVRADDHDGSLTWERDGASVWRAHIKLGGVIETWCFGHYGGQHIEPPEEWRALAVLLLAK